MLLLVALTLILAGWTLLITPHGAETVLWVCTRLEIIVHFVVATRRHPNIAYFLRWMGRRGWTRQGRADTDVDGRGGMRMDVDGRGGLVGYWN